MDFAFVGGLSVIAIIIFVVLMFINRARKKQGPYWLWAIGSFVLACICAFNTPPTSSSPAQAPQHHSAPRAVTAAVVHHDEPAAEPPAAQTDKQALIAEIDSSVTAAKIEGNPSKYVGRVVKLHCTVGNVVSMDDGSKVANATCGGDDDNPGSALVLEGDRIGELDANDQYVIVGHVADPLEGTNTMGGNLHFPAVKFEYNL